MLKEIESREDIGDFLNLNSHLIFHTFEYKKFIEESFGCKYQLLTAIEGDEVKTILPVVEVRNKLLGDKVISSAYLEYGGFAGDASGVREILDFLSGEFKETHGYLEIRGGMEGFDSTLSSKLIKKNLYQRFVLNLGEGEELVWGRIQKSKRKAVKKALKNLEVKELPVSELKDFYKLYCKNMKQFGSPPYSLKYFESFYRNIIFNGLGKIFGSYYRGKLISALVGFCYQDRVHILIAVSDSKFSEFRPNDAMHWSFIKWACSNGFKWFDFGRVREGSGQFEYKRKWGSVLIELPSYFLLWKAKKIPIVDPGKHILLVKIWKKMPLFVTKLIGPWLRKGLGI
ncbi:GNAT family N-acetyltransferase [Candidatus Woesearchaeota archaeon]|nr:GNAT family N-acetyltransferase [Candidatus Woesearchaeota archaeon]